MDAPKLSAAQGGADHPPQRLTGQQISGHSWK
jgi:hypothetical protein